MIVMKDWGITKTLLILLNIIWCVGILVIAISLIGSAVTPSSTGLKPYGLLNALLMIVITSVYMAIVFLLRKIVKSVSEKKPFCTENVKRFNYISLLVFILSLADVVANYKLESNVQILATKYGSIKPSFFIYLILGLLAMLLSQIFNEAVKIKNENDLTI